MGEGGGAWADDEADFACRCEPVTSGNAFDNSVCNGEVGKRHRERVWAIATKVATAI